MSSSPPLKIAHIDTGLALRGGQRQMLLLARGLRQQGHEQVIVCCEGSALEGRALQEGLRVFALPAFDPGHAFGILLWRQELKSWFPSVLHAHDGHGQTVSWLASLGLSVRRVASRRVTFFPPDPWSYRLKYKYTCHAVVAVSENIRDLSVKAGVPRERIEVIPDGIEIPAQLPSAAERARLRQAWKCGDEDFVVGLLGAATAEKGQDVAFAAFALLAQELPNARLALGGSGPSAARGASAHAAVSIRERILCLGPIEDLADFFPGLDLFLMPSKSEGLGSSALWAMAYGLPVVATRVGGLPEVVEESVTGWLVPADSPAALSAAILLAARDRNRLRAFGRQGRKRAEGFSADIMVNRTEALYYRLVSGGQI